MIYKWEESQSKVEELKETIQIMHSDFQQTLVEMKQSGVTQHQNFQ